MTDHQHSQADPEMDRLYAEDAEAERLADSIAFGADRPRISRCTPQQWRDARDNAEEAAAPCDRPAA